MAAGMNAEGGSTGANHRTHASESPLHEWLTVVRDPGAPRWGYFVRAETMHGLFTYLDTRARSRRGAATRSSTGCRTASRSCRCSGTRRFRGEGLFVMDEPEAGLSFSAQLHLVAELAEMARRAAHPGRARHPLTGAGRHPRGVGARAGRARHPADHLGRPRGGHPPPQLPRRAAALPAARHRRPRLTAPRPGHAAVLMTRYGAHDLLTGQMPMRRFAWHPIELEKEPPMAESKARNTDPRYSKLTIGVCPDQWGVWFPQDEKQIDWDVALDEMATAGFSVMETGPFGYFPTEPARLQEEMDERGFKVVAGTGWGILHQAEAWADTEKFFRSIGETHAAVGAEYVVHLPPMFRDEKTGDVHRRQGALHRGLEPLHQERRQARADHEGGLRPEDGPAPPRRQPHRDPRRHRPHLPGDRPRVRRLLPRHRPHHLRRRRPDGAVPQVPRAHLLRAHQGDGPGAGQAGPRRGLAVRQGRARRLSR